MLTKPEKTKLKRAMSPIARMILDDYEENTRPYLRYLTDHMLKCEITNSMHFIMLKASVTRPNEPISEYIHAIGEVRDYLEL